ncbi:MAG TPA: hypothetical protein PKN15_13650 [Chitinophagales bacterium]|nr:hypothetical protein [Chitinophagales bacterium]HNO29832.1 hypothetical protein [Chitinophagales bacterium]
MENRHNIFLSASIPLENRDKEYFDTADVVAIRDAVIALSSYVIPTTTLIWGGHPSITPLIRAVLKKLDKNVHDHVILYQSEYFWAAFPEENQEFEKVVFTSAKSSREESLKHMREEMFKNYFTAAVFIGGMDGVIDEYNMFSMAHPSALLLPLASTGGAAQKIYLNNRSKYNDRLIMDYTYSRLFRDFLQDLI